MNKKSKFLWACFLVVALLFTVVAPVLATPALRPKLKINESSGNRPVPYAKLTSVTTYDWTVGKTVSPTSITITKGGSGSILHTITAIRNLGTILNTHTLDISNIKIENYGNTATTNLRIEVKVESKTGTTWSPILGAVKDVAAGSQLTVEGMGTFSVTGVPYSLVTGATDYRIRIRAYDPNFASVPGYEEALYSNDASLGLFTPASTPTSTPTTVDATATINDVLGTPPAGFSWSYASGVSFPRTITSGMSYSYYVTISNTGLEPGQTKTLNSIVTLTEGDSLQTRTANASVAISTGSVTSPLGINAPAAPAVANRLLKLANVKHKYSGGNYISAVSKEMGPGTDFQGVAKTNTAAYEAKIKVFLNSLGAGIR